MVRVYIRVGGTERGREGGMSRLTYPKNVDTVVQSFCGFRQLLRFEEHLVSSCNLIPQRFFQTIGSERTKPEATIVKSNRNSCSILRDVLKYML